MLDKLYSEKESVMHKVDVKTKVICTFIYVVSLALMNSVEKIIISFVFLYILLLISKLTFKQIFFFVKTVIPAIISISVMYKYVLYKSDFEIMRTCSVLLFSTISVSCFLMTTKVTKMAKAIEGLIPFKKIIPAHEISLMFTIALRFIPLFFKEYKRIKKARICRGIYIEDMNLVEKAKSILGYFIPIFILSLERAYNLAIAMETKGYRKSKEVAKWKLEKLDYLSFLALLVYVVAMF